MTRITGVYTCPDCGATTEGNGEPFVFTNHAATCKHIGGTDGAQVIPVRCPKCNRSVDVGPTSADQCGDDACGIIFNIQDDSRIKQDVDSGPKSKASMREQIARALCRLNGYDPDGYNFEMGMRMWQVASRDVDAMFEAMDVVDHTFLDAAREGLPMESGLAAKFWKAAVRVLKEGK